MNLLEPIQAWRDRRSGQRTVRDWAAVVDQHHRMVVALSAAAPVGPEVSGHRPASG